MSKAAYADNKDEAFQTLVVDTDKASFQFVSFTNTHKYSAAFDPDTTVVELFSTQDCWVRLVASTSSDQAEIQSSEQVKGYSIRVRGGIVKFLGIPKIDGVTWKLGVVRDTASGVLDITEGA